MVWLITAVGPPPCAITNVSAIRSSRSENVRERLAQISRSATGRTRSREQRFPPAEPALESLMATRNHAVSGLAGWTSGCLRSASAADKQKARHMAGLLENIAE